MLNGQYATWKEVLAGVPQGSLLVPLFFLVHINDLPVGLQLNVKIFADDTSLFSVIIDSLKSLTLLNSDLRLIIKWAVQWNVL